MPQRVLVQQLRERSPSVVPGASISLVCHGEGAGHSCSTPREFSGSPARGVGAPTAIYETASFHFIQPALVSHSSHLTMRLFLRLSLACALVIPNSQVQAQSEAPPYDIVIRGGTIVDGTGAPAYKGDVALRGDRIVRIERAGLPSTAGRTTLDARGLVIAPGFIDSHAHVTGTLADFPLAENFVRQGITSIMASLHSQAEPWPLKAFADSLRAAPNVGLFAGHSWIRTRVLGLENRAPSASELAHMEALVDSSMVQGALGLATGLEYVPANYATTDEIIALAKVAGRYGGIYITHMRDEGAGVISSVREVIRIAREAHIPAQINHHKVAGAAEFGWSSQTLTLIDSARAAGLDVTHDLYPYTAFSTISDVLFPSWALADGHDAFAARVNDAAVRRKLEREMRTIFPQQAGNGLASIQFREVPSAPKFAGRTLADYVRAHRYPSTLDGGIRAIIELQLSGGFLAVFHSMDEGDVERIMRHPLAMFETDGDLIGFGVGVPHPRSYGAFPRVLGRYVRDRHVLTLEDAIHRMTELPARQFGQVERGIVKEGAFADLTVFDAARINDLATYAEPHRFPAGIVHVVINGVPVLRQGALTGAMPGRALRGPARHP